MLIAGILMVAGVAALVVRAQINSRTRQRRAEFRRKAKQRARQRRYYLL